MVARRHRPLARPLAVVAGLHALGFSALAITSGQSSGTLLGWALGLSAYALGVRHAFDADHIAVIDGATRTLTTDTHRTRATTGRSTRPLSTGLWFSLGHSSVVLAVALLVAAGTGLASTLAGGSSTTHQNLATIGTTAAGVFLWVIGLVNLAALASVLRRRRRLRDGHVGHDPADHELPGVLARLLRGLTRRIRSPRQTYGVGLLMGLGLDTATEVALLVLAGSAAVALPWHAALTLAVLFTAGMSLFDTLDGAAMHLAYDRAHHHGTDPARRLTYNAVVTGLSVALALGIGTLQLATAAHDALPGATDAGAGAVLTWLSALDTSAVGITTVAAFALIATTAALYRHRGPHAPQAPRPLQR